MVKPMSWRSSPVCARRSLTQSMIMRGSASLNERYAGVCATATMAMSVLLDALIGRSPRVFLERFEVDVGLAGGRPAIDDLLPGAAAIVETRDRPLAGLLPNGAEPHAHAKLIERDVAHVDTDDRLITVVEQDRTSDVGLGLFLPVILHRREDGERDHCAPVGYDDIVGL